MPDPGYSEKIVFSEHGIRLAVLAPSGKITHLDNWDLDMFGGVLPNIGDHITTLWDSEKSEPAESYAVIERHWIGELRGDNCWWLLLQAATPTPAHRKLFKVARDQSSETRAKRFRGVRDEPDHQEQHRQLLRARPSRRRGKPRPRLSSGPEDK